jgi:PBP1b-binding outer membrane lipoprotein LpoB
MRLASNLVTALLALVLTGCAGYTLGPTNGDAASEKSVQVTPFVNQTLEPHLTDALTTEIRKRLQQDGTYKLATRNDSDIILTGVITEYRRSEATLRPEDTFTVRDYRLSLTAVITARSRATGAVIIPERIVRGYTSIRVGSDMTSAERQSLPVLTADLAKNIVALLAEGGW